MSHSGTSENLQKNVRMYIFEHFEEHTTALVLEQIIRKFGLTCSNNMVFFSSKDHLADWIRSGAASRGEALTIEQTLKLSVPIYKTKMSLEYARPSRDQTIAHFQSLGLTGDFWKI